MASSYALRRVRDATEKLRRLTRLSSGQRSAHQATAVGNNIAIDFLSVYLNGRTNLHGNHGYVVFSESEHWRILTLPENIALHIATGRRQVETVGQPLSYVLITRNQPMEDAFCSRARP